MRRLLGFFKNRWFTSIIGLLAIGILIWFVGPLIAIGGTVFLETVTARLIATLICVGLWGLNNLRMQMQVKRANSDLAGAFSDAPQVSIDPTMAQSVEEVESIKARFDEALTVLHKTGGKNQASIYDLPWYIIIGPPGSGKTTALLNSGLKFPLADRFGNEALRGVGGTRNCDWWFTDEAVLIDTAGRYTTQDSHKTVDSAAWAGFLSLLKKHRKRRPINGAMVAISLTDILTQTESERAQQIRAIKQRLQELDKQLGIRFPIYVLLTKCDLIAGFSEFFDDLGLEERSQVWGASFPYSEKKESESPIKLFLSEFDELVARLNHRMLWRMQQERDPQRHAKIFSFPQQMASLRPLLNSFLTEIFASSRYDESLLLRGAYFTSGTQEGSPIDRVMGSMSRTFGLNPQTINPTGGQGRSYFVTNLLKNVIFAESDLAGANRRLEVQRLWLQRAAYGGAVGLTALAILAWMTSFTRNEVHIYQFNDALEQYQETRTEQGQKALSFDGLLERLNSISLVMQVYQPFNESVPLLMGMGLYQGDNLTGAMGEVYREELKSLLLPSVKKRLEWHLSRGTGNTDLQYEALKAYLMLGYEEHRDPELIKLWMNLDWQAMYPGNAEVQGQLQQHLSAMLALDFGSIALDEALVSAVRFELNSVPLSELLYGRMKRDYIAVDDHPFRVLDAVGLNGRNIFERGTGVSLEQGITSLFTYEGYHDFFKAQVSEIADISERERWVLGARETKLSAPEIKQLKRELNEVYFADYIRSWDQLLADVRISKFNGVRHATDSLNALAAPGSPIRSFLREISHHTSLGKSGLLDKAAAKLSGSNSQGRLSRLLQSNASGSINAALKNPEDIVDQHFAPLNALLVEAEGGAAAPIENIFAMLSQLYGQFDAMALGVGVDALTMAKGASSTDTLTRVQLEAARRPEPLKSWLQQVALNARQVTFADARAQINEMWQAEILPLCNSAISGRYPFLKDSSREVTLVDFGRLFGPGGRIDVFFNTHLKPFVEVSGGRWRWKSIGNASIGIPTNALAQFKRAALIKEVYFQTGTQMPSVSFSLKPVYLDANVKVFSLDLEGQQFRYRHGPTRSLRAKWPGPDSTGQVRVEFEDDSGARLASTLEGSWAWFRLLDKSELSARSRDLVIATFIERGRKSTWELRADTVINPFLVNQINQFRCPSSL